MDKDGWSGRTGMGGGVMGPPLRLSVCESISFSLVVFLLRGLCFPELVRHKLCSKPDWDGRKERERRKVGKRWIRGPLEITEHNLSAYFHSLLPLFPLTHSVSLFSVWMKSPVGFWSFVFTSAELAMSHHGDWPWQLWWDRAWWEKERGGGVDGEREREGGRRLETQGCMRELEERQEEFVLLEWCRETEREVKGGRPDWHKHFLTNRIQYVRVNNTFSESRSIRVVSAHQFFLHCT